MEDKEKKPALYEREKLYEEVWSEPVKIVAQRYGVSDVALAKTCRRMAIPLPGRGYWAKYKAGRAPAQTPLGPAPARTPTTLDVPGEGKCRSGVSRRPEPEDPPAKDAPHVKVSEFLRKPHQLVAEAQELLRSPGPGNEIVSCQSKRCLDVAVSRGSLSRALRIMDALTKALEAQGYTVEVTEPRPTYSYYGSSNVTPSVTRVLVGEDWVHFGLSEKRTTAMETQRTSWGHTWETRVYKFTGALSLALTNAYWIDVRKTWNDAKVQRVEDCLGDFIAYLPVVAEKLKVRRLEEERRDRERQEAERRRQEAEKRRAAEERRIQNLTSTLEQWRLAREIREFVREALALRAHPAGRFTWALEYADRIDPLNRPGRGRAQGTDGG